MIKHVKARLAKRSIHRNLKKRNSTWSKKVQKKRDRRVNRRIQNRGSSRAA